MEWNDLRHRLHSLLPKFEYHYHPLVQIALAWILGLWCSSFNLSGRLIPPKWLTWIVICAAGSGWWILRRYHLRSQSTRAITALLILVATIGVSCARFHSHWFSRPSQDISHVVNDTLLPCRIIGVIDQYPLLTDNTTEEGFRPFGTTVRTTTVLRARAIWSRDQWVPVAGRIQMLISGKAKGIQPGSRVEVIGTLARPPSATNPGEFDYRSYLRSKGIRTVLFVSGKEAIVRIRNRAISPKHQIQRFAGTIVEQLRYHLPEHYGIAAALLIGERHYLDEKTTNLFVESGTLHFMAISGMHLGIVTSMLWVVCRLVLMPRGSIVLVVCVASLFYAAVTGFRPPVIRSAILIIAFSSSQTLFRVPRPANVLALATLVVLLINPMDLFRLGFQLSFLAVAIIFWVVPQWNRCFESTDPIKNLINQKRHWALRLVRSLGCGYFKVMIVSMTIWLWTAPLVALEFHIVSPMTMFATPVVLLLVTAFLCTGILFLCVQWIEALAGLLSQLMVWEIESITNVIDWFHSLPGSHWYVTGPCWWQVVVWFGVLSCLVAYSVRPRFQIGFMVVWFGLVSLNGTMDRSGDSLRVTILDVGNGSAAIVEFPDQSVWLVDAGSASGPAIGTRVIAQALWELGVTRIDTIVVSHADLDHFNGIPAIVDRFRVRRLLFPAQVMESTEPAMLWLKRRIKHHQLHLEWVHLGFDYVDSGNSRAVFLHPPQPFDSSDNGQSAVLMIEHYGKRILLPGDLEGSGMDRLLREPAIDVDILISPHHGSKPANPKELLDWCLPEWVMASQATATRNRTLSHYKLDGIAVLSTSTTGAITITLTEVGISFECSRDSDLDQFHRPGTG